jgi:hypothetical protein
MGKYITETDLVAAVGAAVVTSTADDDNDGAADPAVIAYVIDSAEGLVDSYLIGFYTFPLTEPTDRLVRLCALDFAVALLHMRHPEYVRTRDGDGGMGRYNLAKECMLRIQSAVQRLPDTAPTDPPKNVGGIITNSGPRFIIDGPNGEINGGFF